LRAVPAALGLARERGSEQSRGIKRAAESGEYYGVTSVLRYIQSGLARSPWPSPAESGADCGAVRFRHDGDECGDGLAASFIALLLHGLGTAIENPFLHKRAL
jgi:hypothetical protein